MSKDKLGTRMKSQYEHRTRYFLPRRSYTIIRLDGKAFHTFTKGFNRPYDKDLMALMDMTTEALVTGIQGCVLGYVQSDEISLVLTDFKKPTTDAYFDGNIQKIASISASIATQSFNENIRNIYNIIGNVEGSKFKIAGKGFKRALFDSRVFTIPDRVEVGNYLVWRQQDATRNSIQMLGQAHFSHKELHKVNTSQIQDKLMLEKGINWNNESEGFKRGRIFYKAEDGRWTYEAAPIFTKDEFNFIKNVIPKIRDYDDE